VIYVLGMTIAKPAAAPALPLQARTLRGTALLGRALMVMLPPPLLIFLVLGTIFRGIATPTEGGAMGASGALILALIKRRLTWKLLKEAMDATARLTTFVVFILIGARVFSLTFYGVDGHKWVEHLLTSLPGGQLGFLIVVNILIFLLAFFLDFFELSFIVVPLLGPVADKLGIDLIWFGVLLGVNMQTSFMHPPFGFALFYLRSVAPREVKTAEIYWGAVPFVLIQVIMIMIVIAFPGIVSYGEGKPKAAGQIEVPAELQPSLPAAGDRDGTEPTLPAAGARQPGELAPAPRAAPESESEILKPADQRPASPDTSERLKPAPDAGTR
jgi:tripartite ATP-independent transporter DctM subunit